MYRQFLIFVLALAPWQESLAQRVFDGHRLHDAFVVMNLLFVYDAEDFRHDGPNVTTLDEMITPVEVADQAEPDFQTQQLVNWTLGGNWALGVQHVFELDGMEVHRVGHDDAYLWSVQYFLRLEHGINSGLPFRYRAWLSGKGKSIAPRVYLYDAGGFENDASLLSYIALDDLAIAPNAKVLSGDEIRTKAVEHLTKFMEAQPPAEHTDASESEEPRPDWQFHSQTLIEDVVERRVNFWRVVDVKFWRVDFVNRHYLVDGAGPNDVRRFAVWVTEDGRLGTLTLGDDLTYGFR